MLARCVRPLAPVRPAKLAGRPSVLAMAVRSRKPSFHLQPPGGWTNDPNGVHYDEKTKLYHMFYQHHRTSSQWSWGLSWGHAVSEDLVHWSHLPPALDPTPESRDADGVWSGCAFPTDEGTVLLHTAVRKREGTPQTELPPAELDLGHQVIESQQYAIAQPEKDPFLRVWSKGEKAILPLPPQGGLTGWRDPFLVGRPGDGLHDKYTMIIGSGYMDEAGKEPSRGAAFVYTSDNPTSGWKYEGELCQGDGSTGAVWECPLLARVNHHPDYPGPSDDYILVVCPDNPHNTPVYFLGRYDPKTLKFDMENASGPHLVDLGGGPLGSTFYAPNVLNNDPHGRLVMWGWCQETGRPGDPDIYDYGSCLSVPRLIWCHPHIPNLVWQEPLPCLSQLRRDAWYLSGGDSPMWTHITDPEESRDAGGHSNRHSSSTSKANGNGAVASINGNGKSAMANGNKNGNGQHTNGNGNGNEGPASSDEVVAAKPSTQPNSKVNLKPGHPVGLPKELGSHPHLELEITLEPPASLPPGVACKTGMIIRSNEKVPMTAHEASGRNGAALLYDWRHARLEVVFSDGMEDIETLCAAPAATYDMMNATSRVYLDNEAAEAGEAAQHTGETEAVGEHCHLTQGASNVARRSSAPLLGPQGLSGKSGSSEGDHDAEHRPLDVRGCHAVGGQLLLWPDMKPASSNKGNGTTSSGAASSKAAVRGELQPITLRVFMDHSMLEAFTSTGQVLTTRVYHQEDQDHFSDEEDSSSGDEARSDGSPRRRGSPAASDGNFTNGSPDLPPSLELASFGVESGVSNVAGFVLAPIWQAENVTDEMEARAKDNYGAFTSQASSEAKQQEKVNA